MAAIGDFAVGLQLADRGHRSDSIEWPLHIAHQPSRHEGLLRIVVPPFSTRAWMTLTDQRLPVGVVAEISRERPFAPTCPSSGGSGCTAAAWDRQAPVA